MAINPHKAIADAIIASGITSRENAEQLKNAAESIMEELERDAYETMDYLLIEGELKLAMNYFKTAITMYGDLKAPKDVDDLVNLQMHSTQTAAENLINCGISLYDSETTTHSIQFYKLALQLYDNCLALHIQVNDFKDVEKIYLDVFLAYKNLISLDPHAKLTYNRNIGNKVEDFIKYIDPEKITENKNIIEEYINQYSNKEFTSFIEKSSMREVPSREEKPKLSISGYAEIIPDENIAKKTSPDKSSKPIILSATNKLFERSPVKDSDPSTRKQSSGCLQLMEGIMELTELTRGQLNKFIAGQLIYALTDMYLTDVKLKFFIPNRTPKLFLIQTLLETATTFNNRDAHQKLSELRQDYRERLWSGNRLRTEVQNRDNESATYNDIQTKNTLLVEDIIRSHAENGIGKFINHFFREHIQELQILFPDFADKIASRIVYLLYKTFEKGTIELPTSSDNAMAIKIFLEKVELLKKERNEIKETKDKASSTTKTVTPRRTI